MQDQLTPVCQWHLPRCWWPILLQDPTFCHRDLADLVRNERPMPKCVSLAIHTSSGKPYNPELVLNEEPIPYIHQQLHLPVSWSSCVYPLHQYTSQGELAGEAGVPSGESWCYPCHEATETKAVQSWRLSKTLLGPLCICLLTHMASNEASTPHHTIPEEVEWLSQVSGHWSALSIHSQWWSGPPKADHCVQEARHSQGCKLHVLQRPHGEISCHQRDAQGVWAEETCHLAIPGGGWCNEAGLWCHKEVITPVKAKVQAADNAARLSHSAGLEVEGQLVRDFPGKPADLWSSTVQSLPERVFKFALNAVTNTLPYNMNLFLWKKLSSPQCQLCSKEQSLHHVLNNCKVALLKWWYNDWHDKVLACINSFLSSHLPQDSSISVDLPNRPYTFLQNITVADEWPDIVVWNPSSVYMVELTIPWDRYWGSSIT